jgi:hypothetical protein
MHVKYLPGKKARASPRPFLKNMTQHRLESDASSFNGQNTEKFADQAAMMDGPCLVVPAKQKLQPEYPLSLGCYGLGSKYPSAVDKQE